MQQGHKSFLGKTR